MRHNTARTQLSVVCLLQSFSLLFTCAPHSPIRLIIKCKSADRNTTSNLEVVGNLAYRCSNSSPRYSVRTTMLSLYTIQKFLRFPLYKISITLLLFLVCLWKESPQSTAKVQKVCDMAFNYHGLYDDLQVNTPILSPCLWFQSLHKLLFLQSEPTDM